MKRVLATALVIVALAAVASGAWYFLLHPTSYPGTPESVTIGIPPNEQSTLILVAEDQRFFAKNGVNATVKLYETALAALEGMKVGEVDIAETAEFPIVRQAFNKERISVIASIDKFDHVQLVARKDRGIANVSDLKGKKIGAARGTLTEFYLSRFLTLHGIGLQDVTIVNMAFTQSADALANGSVDAFQVQGKDVPPIRGKLDGSVLAIWPSQSGQTGFEVISGTRDWVAGHPETIKRLLKSLDQAAEYYMSHTAEAMAMVQKRLDYSEAYMATLPPQHQYSLTLDQSLILAMEDEARWMIRNNLTSEKQVPNFLDYVHTDGLEAVKPGAVNIIR